MVSDADTWQRPPLLAWVKDPVAYREWLVRAAEWTRDHPEVAISWDLAITEDEDRSRTIEVRRARRAALAWAGVPDRVVEALDGALRPTTATDAVKSFRAARKTFLLLAGKPGAGKTVAACEALSGGGLFVRAVQLARLSAFDAEDKRRWYEICHCRLLVLDDLGAEQLHDGWRPQLDELIDIRYGDRRPIIITTNLDGQSFKQRYGERIADRIRHDGDVISCGDQSLRRREE